MDNNSFLSSFQDTTPATTATRAFMTQVFTYMAGALAITAVTAYAFGNSAELFGMLRDSFTGKPTMLGWVVMFAPLGMVFLLGGAFNRLSPMAMLGLLVVYAGLMGMSLSYIFIMYTSASIFSTFVVTAGTFGAMAILGYTTKTDLTKMGSLLYMALIGIIIAMVVNWFINSSGLGYIISILGVLIFTGLTAYDTQRLKELGSQVDGNSGIGNKLAMMGALSLYLNFINLFLFLLRLFGGRSSD